MSLPVAILAGGKATRLYPLTESIPKSLVDVGGKPFIGHQLELLRRNHIDRVVMCLGFLGERIEEIVGTGSEFGIEVDYVYDGSTLLGTGGALKKALPKLGDAFFVLYGDSFLDIDYASVEEAFIKSRKTALMTVHKNDGKWDRSNVLFALDRIVEYDKKNPTPAMHHIDYGLGVLWREAFDALPEDRPCDLADVYVALVRTDQLAGYEIQQRFYEIGSPAGLAETRQYLSQKFAVKKG
jgi:MurNAc alpha-1-phosphate uridylyltransferase